MSTYTTKAEIEIQCPVGWEPVAFRVPAHGEMYLRTAILFPVQCGEVPPQMPCLIVRKSFVWPDCFPSGWWAAKDGHGAWWAFESKPDRKSDTDWIPDFGNKFNSIDFLNIDWPECDWKDSLMQKP